MVKTRGGCASLKIEEQTQREADEMIQDGSVSEMSPPKETKYEDGSPSTTDDDASGQNEKSKEQEASSSSTAEVPQVPQWVLCGSWNEFENLASEQFVVVPTTDLFRKFASSGIIPPSACVVEIGCANGFCTKSNRDV